MDIIVRYETTDKTHRFVSQIGAFLEDGAHVPATKVKAVTELHFTDLSKEQGEAVITAYGELPEVLGVALDVKPDFVKPDPLPPDNQYVIYPCGTTATGSGNSDPLPLSCPEHGAECVGVNLADGGDIPAREPYIVGEHANDAAEMLSPFNVAGILPKI